ncbi:MAG TPA: glycosyltransferase family 1 protein [Candidatus Baltobacteraceae bacterium]|jgi:glycosyltransferase involved in cell wall biosynthesis|nr:glycosyltransferase family 1 protein [Candidatus Baltobacteraceae bacterium]
MKILFDGYIFRMQRAGGINRYVAEIISGLPADFLPVVTGVEDFGKNAPRHPNLQRLCYKQFRPGRISRRYYDTWWKPRVLRGIDLFHPTYYHLSTGYSLSDFKCPMVLTVHDFVYAIYPKLTEGSEEVLRDQTAAIRRADFVICVSRATENDLLERFPEKRGQTAVIYHGSSFEIQPPLAEQKIFENPAFLFVGGRAGYKNFAFLLRAFAKASGSNSRIRLRVAGAPLSSEERWQVHLLGIGDRVEEMVYPDEQQLKSLYRSSVALVYPSFHEGFGIPPLEAMACRTLAITSNATSLPEVVGDGGIMLDPKREDDWVDCLLKAAAGGADRDSMIERGLERVRMFSWKTTVDRHLEIYRRLGRPQVNE